MLWEATNSETDTIWLLDPMTCEASVGIPHPDGDFNGAGLELDVVGNLWTVGQFTQNAYLIESGLPTLQRRAVADRRRRPKRRSRLTGRSTSTSRSIRRVWSPVSTGRSS